MKTEPTRVVLIEEHQLLAEALKFSLSLRGFDVTDVPLPLADNPSRLLEHALANRPHVVLLDLDLDLGPGKDGAVLIEPLARSGCAVVAVTATEDRSHWGQCLAEGAVTVLAKSSSLDEIASTIQQVRDGGMVLPVESRQELVEEWHRHASSGAGVQARIERLSRREREVLAALALGRRVREVARDSCVAEATVRTQVKSILFKLGVSSQIAAVAVAHDAGLWGPTPPPDLERYSKERSA